MKPSSLRQMTVTTRLKGVGGIIMRVAVVAAVLCLSVFNLSAVSSAQAAVRQSTNIAPQGLGPALQALAKERNFQLVYRSKLVKDLRTQGASGELTSDEALTQLLAGTGLAFRYLDERTVTVFPVSSTDTSSTSLMPVIGEGPNERVPGTASPKGFWNRIRLAQNDQSPQGTDASTTEDSKVGQSRAIGTDDQVDLGEIVVTGTNIRGVRPASPVVTITQEEMRLAGHSNLGEAIRALPQNFSGGQNPGVALGAALGSSVTNQNLTGSSSLNLRGLGPDATLTLLNGTRLPYDGQHQATDVSVIPIAAIERMEILLDGASAIYGSDAVGGVANIILKRDYDGVELSARYGEATDGGYEQTQYTGLVGDNWGSGGFLITGDYSRNTSVKAKERDYLSYMPLQNVNVYPPSTQKGGLLSLHQQFADFAELTLDAFYAERQQDEDLRQGVPTAYSVTTRDSTIWGVAPALQFTLPGEWSARLHGAFGRNDAETDVGTFSIATGAQLFASVTGYFNRAAASGVEAEGPLFALPGGDARLSVGGGYRKNNFEDVNITTGATRIDAEARSHYLYGEINLPWVSEDQGVPFMSRLSLNGALRYESYKTFGDVTTPKVGIVWSLLPGFDLKASWGRSFKVPRLREQFVTTSLVLQPASSYPGTPAGQTVLGVFGGNPDLDPERAEIVTVGFVIRPELLPGSSLEIGWFDIDYTDRVVTPVNPTTQALTNPAFVEFITLNPTVAQQNAAITAADSFTNLTGRAYDPASVHAIVHNQFANATAQHVHGIDLTVGYASDFFGGSLTARGNANWLDSTQKLTSLAPEQQASGFVFFPAEFRGHLGVSWSREGLTLSSSLNHIDGVTNTFVTPNVKGSSMTTLDLVFDYQMETVPLGDIGVNLAVMNLFNEAPPFMQDPSSPFLVNYDSTNYSALGRVISATVVKRF